MSIIEDHPDQAPLSYDPQPLHEAIMEANEEEEEPAKIMVRTTQDPPKVEPIAEEPI